MEDFRGAIKKKMSQKVEKVHNFLDPPSYQKVRILNCVLFLSPALTPASPLLDFFHFSGHFFFIAPLTCFGTDANNRVFGISWQVLTQLQLQLSLLCSASII